MLLKKDRESLLASNQEHIGHQTALKALEAEVDHARDIDIFANQVTAVSTLEAEFSATNQTGSTLFLEMDYKCTNNFSVGLSSFSNEANCLTFGYFIWILILSVNSIKFS